MIQMRSKILALGLALGTLVAVPAFADDAKAQFPMPAATFKQHVDARLAKARTHMEERASKLSAEEAKQVRAKFDQHVAQVNSEVAKVTADGTVTKEEARSVRAASGGHGGGHCEHKGNKTS
jgi:hypothetical protein